jgi:hypothetical protein
VNGAEALLGVFERQDWAGRRCRHDRASDGGATQERGAPIFLPRT